MNILVVGDACPALETLLLSIRNVEPQACIKYFKSAEEALIYAGNSTVDIAFLDNEMDGMDGFALAKTLYNMHERINVFLGTAHTQYSFASSTLHDSEYVINAINPAGISEELNNLRHPVLVHSIIGNDEQKHRYAICEDSKSTSDLLSRMILRISERIAWDNIAIDTWPTGQELLESIRSGTYYDIIFLNTNLWNERGINIADYLRNQMNNTSTQLVFISSESAFMKDTFRYLPVAFLEKPYSEDDVEVAILDAHKRLRDGHKIFMFQTHNELVKVPYDDIVFFESNKRRVKIVTTRFSKYFYDKIDEIEKEINDPDFLRIHQSIYVNLNRVDNFDKTLLHMPNGIDLQVSRGRQKLVKQEIIKYFKRKKGRNQAL